MSAKMTLVDMLTLPNPLRMARTRDETAARGLWPAPSAGRAAAPARSDGYRRRPMSPDRRLKTRHCASFDRSKSSRPACSDLEIGRELLRYRDILQPHVSRH